MSTQESGYTHGVVSGQQVALNGFGNPATVTGSVFDFTGVYLTGAWNNGLSITVSGSLNGNMLYSHTVVVDSYQPTWFAFNYTGIDTLTFNSFGGVSAGYGNPPDHSNTQTHFAMDNFTYQSAVPIPAAAWLFGSGLVGLTGFARRHFPSK